MLAEAPITQITLEKSIVDKLLDKDTITEHDLQNLHMFNDDYIERLLDAGQQTVRYKVAEALMRDGMMEVSIHD